jgi:HlyD family secretion protein
MDAFCIVPPSHVSWADIRIWGGRALFLPNPGKRTLLLTACLLGLAVGAVASSMAIFGYWSGAREATSPVTRPSAKKGIAVAALGRIEPRSEIINLGAGSSPDRLDSLFVERSDLVKKGQVLGHLGGFAEQGAQREMYRAQLVEASLRLKTEVALQLARIEAAEVQQRQVLDVTPHRIAAQEATIASLEAKLANEKDLLDSLMQLFSRGTSTRRQIEDQKALVLQSEASLRAARARLSEIKRQFEIDQAHAAVQIKLSRAMLDRMQAEFPIASLERQIALADARAKRLTLYAPVDGRILNVRVKPGEQIGSGAILTMGDTDGMRAVAEVYETDIAQVRVGQNATITSRALPKPITGRVSRIGNMVFKNDVLNVDPAARADARVVEVWIDLDDTPDVARLTNLTVDVVIATSDSDAALAGSRTR